MLIPLDNRVVVSEIPQTTTKGGITLPASSKELKFKKGVVKAVGTPRVLECGKEIPLPVAVGDTVYFNRNAGIPVTHNGEEYLIISVGELLSKE